MKVDVFWQTLNKAKKKKNFLVCYLFVMSALGIIGTINETILLNDYYFMNIGDVVGRKERYFGYISGMRVADLFFVLSGIFMRFCLHHI